MGSCLYWIRTELNCNLKDIGGGKSKHTKSVWIFVSEKWYVQIQSKYKVVS